MKKLMLTAAMVALPGMALAGNYKPLPPVVDVIAPPPVVIEDTPEYRWKGLYLGGHVSKWTGHRRDFDESPDESLADDISYGAFVGYNLQYGKFVFGPELEWTSSAPGGVGNAAGESLNNIFDIKGRVGVAWGRALPYVFAAYSIADWSAPSGSDSMSGIAYGGGVDFLVTERIFVGADVVFRNMDENTATTGETGYNTYPEIGARVGFKF